MQRTRLRDNTATSSSTTLSLHDALPISAGSDTMPASVLARRASAGQSCPLRDAPAHNPPAGESRRARSEEHTSELQSLRHLVCRLLLEKKEKVLHLYSRSMQKTKKRTRK